MLLTLSECKLHLREPTTVTANDTVIRRLAETAESLVCQRTSIRLAPDALTVPVKQRLEARSGVIRVPLRPLTQIVRICNPKVASSSYAMQSVSTIRGTFADGYYDVTYTAGYDATTFPAGLVGVIIEVLRRCYNAANPDNSYSAMQGVLQPGGDLDDVLEYYDLSDGLLMC